MRKAAFSLKLDCMLRVCYMYAMCEFFQLFKRP